MLEKYESKVISCENLSQFPYRNEHLDSGITASVNNAIKGKKPILFHPNKVLERNHYEGSSNKLKIYLFGVLMNGYKACVILDNVPVYVDIKVPKGKTAREFGFFLDSKFRDASSYDVKSIEDFESSPTMYFQEKPSAYKRVFFNNLKDRERCIKSFESLPNIELCSDDKTSYYTTTSYFRMIARNYGFNTAGWNMFKKYRVTSGTTASHTFRVNLDDFKPFNIDQTPVAINKILSRVRTITATYDIETWSYEDLGEAPKPDRVDTYKIFMMCLTFHYSYSNDALLKVCIVDKPTAPANKSADYGDVRDSDNWLTIVCGSEVNVVKTFTNLLSRMDPDILIGFNNGGFDTPCYINKLKQFGLLAWARDKLSNVIYSNWEKKPYGNKTSEDKAMQTICRNERVKVSPEEMAELLTMSLPGILEADVMVCFRQLYPKAEVGRGYSLNFYLKINKLDSKEDMPYKKMFRIYADEKTPYNALEMREVAKYCVGDAVKCQYLFVKKTIVEEKRELSNMSFVDLFDSFFRANGMKVRNLIGNRANLAGMSFSNAKRAHVEEGKYPGAWVFSPVKGVNRKRPVTGLDFSSLYPSLMMAYNWSPEKIVTDKRVAELLIQAGYKLLEFEFPFNNRIVRGWAVHHNNVFEDRTRPCKLDADIYVLSEKLKVKIKKNKKLLSKLQKKYKENAESSLHEQIISLEKQLSEDNHKQKGLAEASYVEIGRDALPAESMGLFPAILMELFERRAKMKALFLELSHEKEVMEKNGLAGTSEYDDLCYRRNQVNSKQKAMKVHMNTFYGETGNPLSPVRRIEVAGAITSSGRFNIKEVADFLVKRGYGIQYGDTDSVYITCPDKFFVEVDEEFQRGETTREEYWTKMVEITMEVVDDVKWDVFKHLSEFNGTRFLKLAYEEVLFPVCFTGKKKYFGIAHEGLVNFKPKDIFIRGIDIVKTGQTKLAKELGMELLWEICDINSTDEVIDIVMRKVDYIYTKKWDVTYFQAKAKYKPHKQNVSVNSFMERMKIMRKKYEGTLEAALYQIPLPGDPFDYVVVKKEQQYDLRGRKIPLKKADRMEFLSVYNASQETTNPMQIDLNYYMSGVIIGQFARLISYHPSFSTDDATSIKEANKHITKRCNEIIGYNPEIQRKVGSRYQKVYRSVNKIVINRLNEKIGSSADIMTLIDTEKADFSDDLRSFALNQLEEMALKTADYSNTDYSCLSEEFHKFYKNKSSDDVSRITEMINAKYRKFGISIDLFKLRKLYTSSRNTSICKRRIHHLNKREKQCVAKISEYCVDLMRIIELYNKNLVSLITDMRTKKTEDTIDIAHEDVPDNLLDSEDYEILQKINRLFIELVAIYKEKNRNSQLAIAIHDAIAKNIGDTNQPSGLNLRQLSVDLNDTSIEKVEPFDFGSV